MNFYLLHYFESTIFVIGINEKIKSLEYYIMLKTDSKKIRCTNN